MLLPSEKSWEFDKRKGQRRFKKFCPAQQKIKIGLNGYALQLLGLKSDFDFYESFIHKRKRSIRFPAVEFYNSSTITALENQFSSITDFSRTIKCSKLALRVTLLVCGAVKKKHTSGPINGVYDTVFENPLDVALFISLTNLLLNLQNNSIKTVVSAI